MNWEELVEKVERLDKEKKLNIKSLTSYGKMGGDISIDNSVTEIMYEASGRVSVKYIGDEQDEWTTIAWDVTCDGYLEMLKILGYYKEQSDE